MKPTPASLEDLARSISLSSSPRSSARVAAALRRAASERLDGLLSVHLRGRGGTFCGDVQRAPRSPLSERNVALISDALIELRDDTRSHWLRGALALSNEAPGVALRSFEQALERSHDRVARAALHLNVGAALEASGALSAATASYRQSGQLEVAEFSVLATIFGVFTAIRSNDNLAARSLLSRLADTGPELSSMLERVRAFHDRRWLRAGPKLPQITRWLKAQGGVGGYVGSTLETARS